MSKRAVVPFLDRWSAVEWSVAGYTGLFVNDQGYGYLYDQNVYRLMDYRDDFDIESKIKRLHTIQQHIILCGPELTRVLRITEHGAPRDIS